MGNDPVQRVPTETSARAPRRTFASLGEPNFRLYMLGNSVSQCGRWIQDVALVLVVLDLRGRGTDLGLVTGAQFLPTLLLIPVAGVLVDRFDSVTIVRATQAAAAVTAATIGVLVMTERAQLWSLVLLALAGGTANAIDVPARQALVFRVVGPDLIGNAVGLTSVVTNGARIVGPAIATAVVGVAGAAPCFFLNALSFLCMVGCLSRVHLTTPDAGTHLETSRGEFLNGLRYVLRTPRLRAVLGLVTVVGTLTYKFEVSLPLLASLTFGRPSTYGLMTMSMGIGAVGGGLFAARLGNPAGARVAVATLLLGASVACASAAPNVLTACAALVLVGASTVALVSMGSTYVQLNASPLMRGRVIGLWTVAFLGTTPIGGPLIGWIGDTAGARFGIALGAAAALIAGAAWYRPLARLDATTSGPGHD